MVPGLHQFGLPAHHILLVKGARAWDQSCERKADDFASLRWEMCFKNSFPIAFWEHEVLQPFCYAQFFFNIPGSCVA